MSDELCEELQRCEQVMREMSILLSSLRPHMTLKTIEQWSELELLHNKLAAQSGATRRLLESK